MGNRIGAVLVSPNRDHYPFISKLDFDCTNNMVEYEACIMGICVAIKHKIKVLETRDPKLIEYRRLVLEIFEEFNDITFCYLLRDENQIADALATLASIIKVNK
ncbi:RNA-directed DNA polymerase (Reverse transcriptase), Ribonuclease H [Gossypium australe]|uniref:RNA-directed DNA polymerase (Reverse transcriptase), Ribonuclease H n=1 Tax=Gossypium australe TaxID=47621 RepID=A0A5B6WPT7_9ROSI|nr:RNA-directed DNA polymerase (Reverse transcriptase), Ribonuclease H [Gossypium australe]